MDNNNYQPMYEQPKQTPYSTPQDVQQKTDHFFSQALAATIMSVFPIASIIALIKGKAILPEIVDYIASCTALGITIPGKLKTAKILATVGKFAGLGFTIYYGISFAFLAIYFIFAFCIFFLGFMGSLL